MLYLYFHDCYKENLSKEEVVPVLTKWIADYVKLVKDNKTLFASGVMTDRETGKVQIVGHTLKDLLSSIPDRTVKGLALHYFTKFPLDSNKISETDLEDIYTFAGCDNAFSLYIAYKNNYVAGSLPLQQIYTAPKLHVSRLHGDDFDIHNWSGNNNNQTCLEYATEQDVPLVQLQVILRKPEITDSFKKLFAQCGDDVQRMVVEKFREAIVNRLLFPVVVNGANIKACKGIDHLFELRIRHLEYRVYFYEKKGKITLGGINTKSAYKDSVAQNADMELAMSHIKAHLEKKEKEE